MHNDPALGGYTDWSFYKQLQVPGCCKHDNPALGGYICGIFSLWLMIEMNNPDFFKVATLILKQVLSYHYVLLLRLGGYRYYAYKGGTSSVYQFWANQEDQLHDPVSTTIMTRCHQYLQTGNFGNIKPPSFRSSNRLNIRWVFQDPYFLNRRFGSRLKWIILHNISLWETNVSKLSMKLACWPGFSGRRKWQGLKDDEMPVYKNS